MSVRADGGGDSREEDIAEANWRLWVATMQENGSVAAADGYVVDPEKAEGCIRELDRIANDVRQMLTSSWGLFFDAPGFDVVSQNVAHQGAVMGKRAEVFIATWANQIEATRDALVAQLAAYREVELTNGARRA